MVEVTLRKSVYITARLWGWLLTKDNWFDEWEIEKGIPDSIRVVKALQVCKDLTEEVRNLKQKVLDLEREAVVLRTQCDLFDKLH